MNAPVHAQPGKGEASDVLVIGAGAAGLSVALAAAPRQVRVLGLDEPGRDGASTWAQGGIAAALGPHDSPALHADDTLAAGQWLNRIEAVERLTASAAAAIHWLQQLGAQFDRDGSGLLLGREAAHGHARIVHAQGDATGAEVMRVLQAACRAAAHVELLPARRAIAMAQDADGRVVGAWAWNGTGIELWPARAVVLATGGYAALYRYTTNPASSDGSGIALALAAGARLADLEFVQFHPTALAPHASDHAGRLPLLTEALRGAGAVLVDVQGRRVMAGVHPLADLAPRDVVARVIAARRLAGEDVFLDARQAVGKTFAHRFPTVFAACTRADIDPCVQPIPVTPAAHYCMGGVWTDDDARTSLTGLYAVGEAAASGVHGANRLASNSLLEGLAFGRQLGQTFAAAMPAAGRAPSAACPRRYRPLVSEVHGALTALLWSHAGLVRCEAGLAQAARAVDGWLQTADGVDTGTDLLRFAAVLIEAMRRRTGSIGAHWRSDAQQAA